MLSTFLSRKGSMKTFLEYHKNQSMKMRQAIIWPNSRVVC